MVPGRAQSVTPLSSRTTGEDRQDCVAETQRSQWLLPLEQEATAR